MISILLVPMVSALPGRSQPREQCGQSANPGPVMTSPLRIIGSPRASAMTISAHSAMSGSRLEPLPTTPQHQFTIQNT